MFKMCDHRLGESIGKIGYEYSKVCYSTHMPALPIHILTHTQTHTISNPAYKLPSSYSFLSMYLKGILQVGVRDD